MQWKDLFRVKPKYVTVSPDIIKRKDNVTKEVVDKKDLAEGLWFKCEECGQILYNRELDRNLKVCLKCGYHFRLSGLERLAILLDQESFLEYDADLQSLDPLEFHDLKKYPNRIAEAQQKTGLLEAVMTGEGKIFGHDVIITALDFNFMAGSMGSVVGEKISRAIEKAVEKRLPVIICSTSGGARMQEGMLSLMQMAKTSAALGKLHEAGLFYISILTDPTTGGVTASFASLGDVIIAESGAVVGFTGRRVIEQTIKQKLPPNFQTAEFLLEHGLVDMVVERKELKNTVGKLLDFHSGNKGGAAGA